MNKMWKDIRKGMLTPRSGGVGVIRRLTKKGAFDPDIKEQI